MSDVSVLSHAIDQVGDVLDHVHPDQLGGPTPCSEWDVATLLDHVLAQPGRFLTMMRGEEVDWAAPVLHVEDGWGPAFRVAGDDLIHRWHELDGEPPVPAGMQIAEFAVHTWDVATAIGYPVDRLDPEVAEFALAFLRDNLPADRGPMFAAAQESDGGPYEQLAAFAGRSV